MSTAIATQSKNEVAPISLGDPLEAYADIVAPRYIIGELLRFSKGDYLAGESGKEVPAGTVFTAAVDELMAGWVKWNDGRPVEHVMVRVADGRPLPKRADLGDDNQSTWDLDANNKPRDPWQFTNYLPLLSEIGELYTFTTSSRGGISAIAGLARRHASHRKRHPEDFPLVALGVDSYDHANKQYGRIKIPVFAPAGYVPERKFLEALAAAGIVIAESASIEGDAGDELNDCIPL